MMPVSYLRRDVTWLPHLDQFSISANQKEERNRYDANHIASETMCAKRGNLNVSGRAF